MLFVFDNSSLSELKHFYPNVFTSLWAGLDDLYEGDQLISTREVWNEFQRGVPSHVEPWLKARKSLFKTPDADELAVVRKIFQIPHFQSIIAKKQILKGNPVADPFLIGCAKVKGES